MLTIYCPVCYAANAETRSVCAECGASLAEEEAGDFTDRLLWALHHPEPTVAPRAAWVLGERRDRRAVEPLIALTARTREMGALEEAARALGKIGDPRAIPALVSLLRGSYVSVRVQAARALGAIGGTCAVSALTQARTDPSASVRAAAQEALNALADREASRR
jgi:HEAT repeat protein